MTYDNPYMLTDDTSYLMGVIPQRPFDRCLQQCSNDEFCEFVARLWDVSDWETTVTDNIVEAMNDTRRERLLVVPPSRLSRLPLVASTLNVLPSGLSSGNVRRDFDGSIDRVVVPYDTEIRGNPRGLADVPVVDSTALRHRLLYGIDADAAEELCLDILGVPLRAEQWDDTNEQEGLIGRLTAGESASALASRRTVLGLLGIGALGAVAFVLQERSGEDSEAPPLDEPAPTPETAPDTTFEFELEGEFLQITHAGGESVETDQIVVEGDGFVGEPRFAWSDSLQFEEGSTVEAGDAIELTVRDDLALEVIWDDTETLATFEETAPEVSEADPIPDMSFEFTFTERVVTVEYTGEDPIRAEHVQFRGSDFGDDGQLGWNDATVVGQGVVERTDFVSFEADSTATISAYWVTPSRQVLVEQFTGPDRPLDPSDESFPAYGGTTANTGYLAENAGPTGEITTMWSFESEREIQSSPVVVDGVVYVGDFDTMLYALDAVDGAELWRFELESGVVGPSAPAVADILESESEEHRQTVFVGDAGGTVYAIDAQTGESIWQRSVLDGVTAAPVVAETEDGPVVVFTGPRENHPTLVALDARDGTRQWWADEDPDFNIIARSHPAVADGTLYTGSLGGAVTALDLEDGSERWRRPREEEQRVEAFLAVSDDTVFATTVGGSIFAFDSEDGTEQWGVEWNDQILNTPVLIPNLEAQQEDDSSEDSDAWDGVVIGDITGRVVALDSSDGDVRWEFDAGSSVGSASAVTGSDGQPALYFGTTDGEVFGLDAASGTVLWDFEPEELTLGTIWSPPAVVDSVVYVSYEHGEVYALTEE